MDWLVNFFNSTDGTAHVVGGLSAVCLFTTILWKSGKGVKWMYSTDESDFSDHAKLVLCELRKPFSGLKAVNEAKQEVTTDKVTVTCRNGWFHRRPKVVISQGDKDISHKLTYPERRVIKQVVKSRLVDARRRLEHEEHQWIRASLS